MYSTQKLQTHPSPLHQFSHRKNSHLRSLRVRRSAEYFRDRGGSVKCAWSMVAECTARACPCRMCGGADVRVLSIWDDADSKFNGFVHWPVPGGGTAYGGP
jgi:hypothetical protein